MEGVLAQSLGEVLVNGRGFGFNNWWVVQQQYGGGNWVTPGVFRPVSVLAEQAARRESQKFSAQYLPSLRRRTESHYKRNLKNNASSSESSGAASFCANAAVTTSSSFRLKTEANLSARPFRRPAELWW